MSEVRIELDIEDEIAALNLSATALLTPVAVWFSGSSARDITVEFEVADDEGVTG